RLGRVVDVEEVDAGRRVGGVAGGRRGDDRQDQRDRYEEPCRKGQGLVARLARRPGEGRGGDPPEEAEGGADEEAVEAERLGEGGDQRRPEGEGEGAGEREGAGGEGRPAARCGASRRGAVGPGRGEREEEPGADEERWGEEHA